MISIMFILLAFNYNHRLFLALTNMLLQPKTTRQTLGFECSPPTSFTHNTLPLNVNQTEM